MKNQDPYKINFKSFLLIFLSLIITLQVPIALAGINTSDQDGDGYYSDPPVGGSGDPDDHNPCIPDETTAACQMAKDPLKAIEDVKKELNDLIASGSFDINSAQAKALLAKLTSAAKYIDSGKTNVAINNLNAFNNQVNAYINSGNILPEAGQELISKVNNVINSLK